MEKFWICWAPSKGNPTHKHYTLLEADAEAARLAQKLKTEVAVLEFVGGWKPSKEVERLLIEPKAQAEELLEDDIPY